MDVREYLQDPEEAFRIAFAGEMVKRHTMLPVTVTQDSQDGHTAVATPTIKRQVTNPDGSITYEDHPEHPDLPIHHIGGGPVVVTHPTKQNDEGIILYASRAIDTWFQSGDSQQPIEDRAHSLADGMFLSGVRSTPNKLQQVSQVSTQTRTVDKKNVVDHGPDGTKIKAVDPSTQAASQSFDPYKDATKHYEHGVHPTEGHRTAATDGGTVHEHTTTHDDGFKASANNGAHSIAAHPSNGVGIASTVAHTIQAPNASLSAAGAFKALSDITSSGGNVSAPSGTVSGMAGQFASGFLGSIAFGPGGLSSHGGGGGGGGNGGLAITNSVIAAPTLQSNATYTVAQLNQEMPPTPALTGTRAVVTDAVSNDSFTDPNDPSAQTVPVVRFMTTLKGGGVLTTPAWCSGTAWLAA